MTRRTLRAITAAIAILAVTAPDASSQIIGDPAPSLPTVRQRAKKPKKRRASEGPSREAAAAKHFASVPPKTFVLPPVDIELERDQIYPVKAQLGLVTLIEFPEPPEYVWFSGQDRWTWDKSGRQLGLRPGTAESGLIDWSRVRETLYVRVAAGFTYKFTVTVGNEPPHSIVRVREKVLAPPPPSPEELARERAAQEAEAREKAARAAEKVTREAGIAAARAVPLPSKKRREGDLEARAAAPVATGGKHFALFEIVNRGKSPLQVTAALVEAGAAAPMQGVEFVLEAGPLSPRQTRTGVAIWTAKPEVKNLPALRLTVSGRKPLELPLGEKR